MIELWEILVPTEKPFCIPGKKRYFSTKYHKKWDEKVAAIAGGLTILRPAKGHWVSPSGDVFKERVIPVRIACTREQIEIIMDVTQSHYMQLAVMAYKVSEEVLIKSYGGFALGAECS